MLEKTYTVPTDPIPRASTEWPGVESKSPKKRVPIKVKLYTE